MRKFAVALALTLASPLFAHAQQPVNTAAPATQIADTANYVIQPGDELQVVVWKNPELSATSPVRPDGKITMPLVKDVQAEGKTPIQLSNDITTSLSQYIQNPAVTVTVRAFSAPAADTAIKVIGSAMEPKTVPYRKGITALDVVIQVGGLPIYASGNRAEVIRLENGVTRSYPLRLNDLVKKGDLKRNLTLLPGDVIRIPERFF